MRAPALRLLAALVLPACQPGGGLPAAATPTPGMITFTRAARGPVPFHGGAFVVDPGTACPGQAVHVVGAGLPAGSVALALIPAGEPGATPAVETSPIALRADGSFDQRLAMPPLADGSRYDLSVRWLGEGAEFTSVPLATCPPSPPIPFFAP